MGQFIALCWRDLWRNRRRTILTGLVMVFAVAVMVLFIAMGDGSHLQMIRGATDSFLGHVQVQQRAYQDDPNLENVIPPAELDVVLERMGKEPGVTGFAPRLLTGGLLSKKVTEPLGDDDMAAYEEMTSEGVFVVGVRPRLEATVSTLLTSVRSDDPAGRCLRGCRGALSEVGADASGCEAQCEGVGADFAGAVCHERGRTLCKGRCDPTDDLCDEQDCRDRFADYCQPARFLLEQDPLPDKPYDGEILLGSGLAKVLDVGVGDRVALTTGTARGRTFASLYRVTGIVKTGSLDINRTFAVTHYDKLAAGLETPGAASAVVVSVEDIENADDVAEHIDESLADLGGLVAMSWRQLAPELDLYVKIDQGSLLVMLLLMIMIVGVILANVVTMAVMERTREYGVRLALGEPPSRITWGLITEVALLALVSSLIGAAIGEAFNYHYMVHGIDFGMGEIETAGVVFSSLIYTELTLYGLVFSVGTVVFFAVLGAVFPALRIRRLRPVEALRFV